MVGLKQTVWGDFFVIKLLLQPDLVFDSKSNGCNLVGGFPIFFSNSGTSGA